MASVCFWDTKADDEVEITHKNLVELDNGFHIVENYKRINKPTAAKINKALDEGHTVHKADCYGGDGEDDVLWFTGKVIWSHTKIYETSSLGGYATAMGPVPAGTLIVNLGDD